MAASSRTNFFSSPTPSYGFPHPSLHPSSLTPANINSHPIYKSSTFLNLRNPSALGIESFMRDGDDFSSDLDSKISIRARFVRMIKEAQDRVCEAIENVDGGGRFKEDAWSRSGGGGGISKVIQSGDVWEKAGVNISVVYGIMPPDAYRAAKNDKSDVNPGNVPFFAAGISSVLHPNNPFAPTLHFNYRYFETDSPKDAPGAPLQWWFGGGTDLTPAYIFEDDVKHFHAVQKRTCDKYDNTFYPRFKKWCDDYFYIKHRGERRGVGGIFFDDLCEHDQEMLFEFTSDCVNAVFGAYLPIVQRRKDTAFTDRHRRWQQLRRGRYAEFNLVYDRGTTFGLKTGGRIESILVSLPLTARWEYDTKPEEGSEEWKLLDACINPREWL